MTKVQYKNWKTEIAWLRRLSKKCRGLAVISDPPERDDFHAIALALANRADALEEAKGTAQSS